MSNNQTRNVPLDLKIKEGDFAKLVEGIKDGKTPSEAISGWCAYFLQQYANGGMLLKSTEVDYLSKIAQAPINDAAQIAKLVEGGLGRKRGQFTFEIDIDPAYVPIVAEHAQYKGWTSEEIIRDLIGQCFDNGWVYNMLPGRQMAAFDEKERNELAGLLGNNFTGKDIVNYIRNLRITKEETVAA